MTGDSLRKALAEQLGIPIARLPAARTLRRVMNRNGFLLKKVRKTMPLKKIKKTNAIFDNVFAAHERAQRDPSMLRISIDVKAKVKIGPFSRGGKTRQADDRDACDHDFAPEDLMVPCGILEVEACQLTIGFGHQVTTSDLLVDNLEQWWLHRREHYGHIRTLMIDLDNGPECSSHRTQFMKRVVDFADKYGLEIELVYYPPYHSKYNRIEGCWGILEEHWNGTILRTIETMLSWAASMTWHGVSPILRRLEGAYKKGVTWTKKAFAPFAARLQRRQGIEKWSVVIRPRPASTVT
jgi:transposase